MQGQSQKLSKNLSSTGAFSFALGTSLGWGSLVVTTNTYLANSGPAGSVLGILAASVIMLAISRSYAYLMESYPDAGGAFTYVKEAFGWDHGFLAAWFLALTYMAVFWANATSLPLFARYFLGGIFRVGKLYTLLGYDVYVGEILLSSAAIILTAILCARHKKASFRIMATLVFLFAAGITIVFIGALFCHQTPMSPAFVPDKAVLGQIVKIAVISPWAFIGFENISHMTEEYRFRPKKGLSILVWAVIVTALLYIFIILLSVTAYPPQYDSWLSYIRDLDSLSGLEALPPFYAAYAHMGNAGVSILILSLLALILTSLVGNLTALSRLIYALGREHILPERLGKLNDKNIPANAIMLIAAISAFIPLLGRTPIGWIVDVTTLGATLTYGYVSASARKLAIARGDRKEAFAGTAGLVIMTAFLLYTLLPDLVHAGSMATETYFLFVVWSVLGFLFFRLILRMDEKKRFGQSIIVWIALLALVLFISLIWMRQSMIDSNNRMISNIQSYYAETADGSERRQADEAFIEEQIRTLEESDSRTILMATAMFAFALFIIVANYSYMRSRTKESEAIANRDAMTGVKSKYAHINKEKEIDQQISEGTMKAFAVVVCDVNGLKYINDTYGHKAGDDYIRQACAMICEEFAHSPVFRVGGDEFVAITLGRDYESRDELMADFHKKVEANLGTDNAIVAAGISDYIPGTDTSYHAVFARADEKMYQRKQALKDMGAKSGR